MWQWWIGVAIGMIVVSGLVSWGLWRRRQQVRRVQRDERAKRLFRQRREWLEARCMTLASESGKPRGLIWSDCDFDDAATFARDRHSGALQALVAVTIRFEAEVGGGMEDIEAVHRLRAATAVFRFDGESWETDGRVVFNLTPHETIEHFRHELEPVDVGSLKFEV